jgi:thiol:disulfide interchange protein
VTAAFIWLAASAGALSLLTPCVFPMIPITVSYFAQHSGVDRRTSVRNALVFGAGIVLTFTALGFALAVLVGATGVARFAANPWVNLGLTAVFVAFALSLFGVVHIAIPSRLVNALDAASRNRDSAGMIGALLMGLTFTLTSFTCTAPFVGTVLVTAAQGQWTQPLVGMLTYSIVFALPFFVLALAPQSLSRLPRAGNWMASVKITMGILELAAAMKFLSNADLVWRWGIFTRSVVLATWVVLALALAWYLAGRSWGGRVGAAVAVAAGVWLATGIAGRPLGELESFLPQSGAQVELAWKLNDYEGALARAQQEHRAMFIDFTGYTCTNCRWMEANMFTRPEIKRAMDAFVLARLFTDGDAPLYDRQQAMQQARYGTVALPFYAIVAPDGRTLASFPGLTRNPDEFLAFLHKGTATN